MMRHLWKACHLKVYQKHSLSLERQAQSRRSHRQTQICNAFTCSVSLKCLLTALYILNTVSNDRAMICMYSRTSIIRPPLGSGPWIGVRIREMFRIRRMSTCAHYMYLISKVVENYDLSCPSRTSTRLHIHHTSNANITSMMF